MRCPVAVVLCGLVLLIAGGVCAAATWYIHTVDSRDVGAEYAEHIHSSIALDAGGRPHISYAAHVDGAPRDLAYATWNGTSWDIQTVDSSLSMGRWNSLQLDSNGRAHISYHDDAPTKRDLKYAAWNGVSWDIQTVDSAGFTGYHTSLALDANDRPHISYLRNTNPRLKYATWNGTTWEIQTVDSTGDAGLCTSLALDAGGYPHISYYDHNSGARYASWNGSNWDIQTVDGGGDVGHSSSLALDASGYAHISYRDNMNGHLKYAAWKGSDWLIQTVDSAGKVHDHGTSLALDASGRPHISYVETVSQKPVKHELKYASWNGSTWEIETVDPGWCVAVQVPLALDADGYAHISYAVNVGNRVHRVLRYATTRGPTIPLSDDLPTTGYYMVSVPLMLPGGTTAHDLLCDDLGHTAGSYSLWGWQASDQAYRPGITPPDACTAAIAAHNDGVWLRAPAGPIDIEGTMPPGDQAIPLQPGWNMVGPLHDAMMDSLLVDNAGDVRDLANAQAAGWLMATFSYSHDGSASYSSVTISQSPPDQLSVWYGYWVLAEIDCSLIVPQPSRGNSATAMRASRGAASPLAWAFDIHATTATATDTITVAASDSASDGFDGFALDKPKPPRPPGGATLRMVLIPDAAAGPQAPWASDLAMETRSAAQGEAEWHFTVTGGLKGEPVTPGWPSLSRLPRDRVAILTDRDTGKRTFMRTRAQYEFAAPGDGSSRSFMVTVKPAQEGALLISGLSAVPTRGGAWDIGFSLSADAAVTARVYNVTGRLVADITDAEQVARGHSSLSWHRRGLTGTHVPSGTYLLRVTARTQDGQQASAVTTLQLGR